ncbi:hypothetical protein POM88_048004 [Heracleum sosnowskyi]|uniref:Leucine-rich repeat-containing N-terminal plant-type domain-containing protein n=1 Tax=Heracleum sosnowskyi TaxID=360622 RepID=A0AAD8GVF0_9APIA|nr:hypothetical protein POM88_048004 [Heracleum sosnowskyi]
MGVTGHPDLNLNIRRFNNSLMTGCQAGSYAENLRLWPMWMFILKKVWKYYCIEHYVVVSSPSVATTHLSPNMQKSALFQFKLSLSIINDCGSVICEERKTPPAYPKTMNWSMSSNYCTWDGVTCDKTTGNVIRLDLGCSCLVGSIPPNSTLFQLSYLQTLGHKVRRQEIRMFS